MTIHAQQSNAASAGASPTSSQRQFLDRYCASCHNERLKTGGLSLVQADLSKVGAQPELWEKVARKLHTGVMPPPNMPQPPEADRRTILTWLETSLDAAAAAKPNPGRIETLRRLTRTEYQNAIRDLLALDIDAASLLPADESGHGFDNVIVGDLSATLVNRYISAAQKISRLAVGTTQSLQNDIIRVPADLTQEDHLPGLPRGTRGGMSTTYTFPRDGEYEIQILLARDINGAVSGLRDPPSAPTPGARRPGAGQDLHCPKAAQRPPHTSRQGFESAHSRHRRSARLRRHIPQRGLIAYRDAAAAYRSRFNDLRYARTAPAIDQISVTGPYAPKASGDTPSRRRLFVCRPAGPDKAQEEKCAATILSTLMRRAYRRPIARADVDEPMTFYRKGRAEGGFDAGIAMALSAVLTNGEFLIRVESEPRKTAANGIYRVSDLELASRLSFFLWSSIPDDELLDAAIRGRLSQPGELEKQARRMLADRRSFNLATNFAGQWLRLRNIDAVLPNGNIFRDFDDNLRQAFRQESELFFDSVLCEDRSVRTFLRADYTFLNERLAKHYGIPTSTEAGCVA